MRYAIEFEDSGKVYGRQAIETRYLGATDSRGSRVKATCEALTITLPWDDALDSTDNHVAAARALLQRLGWVGTWACGATKGSRGYVFVNVADGTAFRVVAHARG